MRHAVMCRQALQELVAAGADTVRHALCHACSSPGCVLMLVRLTAYLENQVSHPRSAHDALTWLYQQLLLATLVAHASHADMQEEFQRGDSLCASILYQPVPGFTAWSQLVEGADHDFFTQHKNYLQVNCHPSAASSFPSCPCCGLLYDITLLSYPQWS